MPHTRSAKKNLRKSEKHRLHNRAVKKAMKAQIKRFVAALEGPVEETRTQFGLACKKLDKAAAKRVVHPNLAARKKSQLARALHAKEIAGATSQGRERSQGQDAPAAQGRRGGETEIPREEVASKEREIAMALSKHAAALEASGRLEDAEQAYQQALAAYRQGPQRDDAKVALTLSLLGKVRRDLRLLAPAAEAYREALTLYRTLARSRPHEYAPFEARSLYVLATVYSDLRQPREAEPRYRAAQDCWERLVRSQPNNYMLELAVTLHSRGNVVAALGKLEEATDCFKGASAVCRRLAREFPELYNTTMATTLADLGGVLHQAGRWEEADAAYSEALALYDQLAKTHAAASDLEVAMTLHNRAAVRAALGQLGEAEKDYQQALMRKQYEVLPDCRSRTLSGLGQLLLDQGRLQEAENALREAVQQIEAFRTEALPWESRKRVLRENARAYERLFVCLMKQGRNGEALEIDERGKSRRLIDLLALRATKSPQMPDIIAQEYHRLLTRAEALQDELSRL